MDPAKAKQLCAFDSRKRGEVKKKVPAQPGEVKKARRPLPVSSR